MNIIYNFWLEPLINPNIEKTIWEPRLMFQCLCLSFELMKKLDKKMFFYGDKKFIEYINFLGLKFDKITVVDRPDYSPDLWCIMKPASILLQNEPFLLVDYDVFIFKDIFPLIENRGVVVQSVETEAVYKYYIIGFDFIRKYLPEVFEESYGRKYFETFPGDSIKAYCVGILGGTDLEFLKRYATEALKIGKKCSEVFEKNNIDKYTKKSLNIITEQWLLYALALEEGQKIDTLLKYNIDKWDELSKEAADMGFCHLLGSVKNYHSTKFHVARGLIKTNPNLYDKVEELLKMDKLT
jgi:hypothetical protein